MDALWSLDYEDRRCYGYANYPCNYILDFQPMCMWSILLLIHQRYGHGQSLTERRMDRRTDRRTTCNRKIALLHYCASRGKNYRYVYCTLSPSARTEQLKQSKAGSTVYSHSHFWLIDGLIDGHSVTGYQLCINVTERERSCSS